MSALRPASVTHYLKECSPGLSCGLLELEFVEFGINPAGPEQFRVGARFDNAALVQYHNEIGPLDGREAVGDADRRAALHQCFERLLDNPLGFGIERAGGLVQDQDRRVLDRKSTRLNSSHLGIS